MALVPTLYFVKFWTWHSQNTKIIVKEYRYLPNLPRGKALACKLFALLAICSRNILIFSKTEVYNSKLCQTFYFVAAVLILENVQPTQNVWLVCHQETDVPSIHYRVETLSTFYQHYRSSWLLLLIGVTYVKNCGVVRKIFLWGGGG